MLNYYWFYNDKLINIYIFKNMYICLIGMIMIIRLDNTKYTARNATLFLLNNFKLSCQVFYYNI